MNKPLEVRAGMYHDREPDEVVMIAQEELRKFSTVTADGRCATDGSPSSPAYGHKNAWDQSTAKAAWDYAKASIYREGTDYYMSNTTGKALVSLEDWNNRRVQTTPEICWNGIACPKCGKEMFDSTPSCVLCCNPPRMGVACACGFHGTRLV